MCERETIAAPSMLRFTSSAVALSLDLDGRDDWDTRHIKTASRRSGSSEAVSRLLGRPITASVFLLKP